MKGSNKKFARYLESEIYDDYLEAQKDNKTGFDYHQEELEFEGDSSLKTIKEPKDKIKEQLKELASNKNQQSIQKPVREEDNKGTPLTNEIIKELCSLLGEEAQKCFYALREIKFTQDKRILSNYEDLYSKYETVPVFFLSVIRNQAVYVWQINRKCPVQKGTNNMILDSKAMSMETKRHVSLLLLAKITSTKGEEILDARFIDDNKLLIRVKLAEKHLEIKLYNIADFVTTTRVNPFKCEIVANELYYLRVSLKGFFIDGQRSLEVSLFKKKTIGEINPLEQNNLKGRDKEEEKTSENIGVIETEIMKDTKVFQGLRYEFGADDNLFSEFFVHSEDVYAIIDKSNSMVVAWKNDALLTFCYDPEVGEIESVMKTKDCCYLVDSQMKIYLLSFKDFGIVSFEHINISLTPSYFMRPHIEHYPKKLYNIASADNIPKIVFPFENSFYVLSLETKKSRTNWYPRESLSDVTNALLKTKSYNWTVCGQPKLNIIFYLTDHHMYFAMRNRNGFVCNYHYKIPLKDPKVYKIWDIIGSGERFFLCGRVSGSLDIELIEIKINADSIYGFESFAIEKEGQAFRYDESESLFGQVEGPDEKIAFIRFSNEPFYLDKANLLYDEEIYLVNPYRVTNIDNSVDDFAKEEEEDDNEQQNYERKEKKEEEKKFLEKINRYKNGFAHNKKTKALEEVKNLLKEIRADISSSMKEKRLLNKEQEINDLNMKEEFKLDFQKGVCCVSKESFSLINEIRAEKKKLYKEKDKKKSKIRKERLKNVNKQV